MERGGNGSKNILNLYFKEVKSFSLLSPEEEKRLFRRLLKVSKTGKSKKIKAKKEGRGKKKEERELNEIEKEIIERNQRLVIGIAREYQNRGMDTLDLINEGNLGLIRAIRKFDLRKGYKFSTYATWWIKASISRAIFNKARVIRLPLYLEDELRKLRKVRKKILRENAREPTLEEIAEEMNISPAKADNLVAVTKKILPLDTMVSVKDEGILKLEDVIIDENSASPEEELKSKNLKIDVAKILSALPAREEKLLRLRFGIGIEKGKAHTLREIGNKDEFKLTRERIRQIQERALNKLRRNPKIKF